MPTQRRQGTTNIQRFGQDLHPAVKCDRLGDSSFWRKATGERHRLGSIKPYRRTPDAGGFQRPRKPRGPKLTSGTEDAQRVRFVIVNG